MIIVVAAFIYIPSLGHKPASNFVYLTSNYIYTAQEEYSVQSGHITYTPPNSNAPVVYPQSSGMNMAKFYLYDVSKNTSTQLTFTEAQSYNLDPSVTSSDGYSIEQGSGGDGGGSLFVSNVVDYNDWFIKGHNRSWKLNISVSNMAYDGNNFMFLGWVQ